MSYVYLYIELTGLVVPHVNSVLFWRCMVRESEVTSRARCIYTLSRLQLVVTPHGGTVRHGKYCRGYNVYFNVDTLLPAIFYI